ncbi:hypothetical protein Q7P37_011458 [Cladosporium fusiforme]
MSTKPIKLYSHAGGPNPWKVAIILNELDLPYETEIMDFADLKKEPFLSISPNGRVPAITDPNTNLTLWESGAIVEYLLNTYDAASHLHYRTSPNKHLTQQWLHFQTSGQGPYYGQKAWFTWYHEDKNLTSVLERYGSEIWRVIGVVDAHLGKTGGEWLVGDKCTYADLAFVPWFWLCPGLMGDGFEQEWKSKYPTAWAWYQKLQARPSVTKAREDRQKAMEKH